MRQVSWRWSQGCRSGGGDEEGGAPIKGRILSASIGALALVSLFAPGSFSAWVQLVAARFLDGFGGWTLFVSSACVVFCAAVLVAPHGRRLIGGEGAVPEFRLATWTAMMFAAGMGSGLVFWGAAEPVIHWLTPPPGEALTPRSAEARERALALTQFNWALHGWGVYAAAAIAIGLFMTRAGPILPSLPFTRLGPRARRAIDIAGLVAVLFGVVASLGQSVLLLGAGAEIVSGGGLPGGLGVQLVALLVIAAGYLGSAALGLRRGIAILSNVNAVVALVLAAWVLIAGPTGAILATAADSAAAYLSALPELSVNLREGGKPRTWTNAWSLTYFLWWIAWTPFVGVFLARISRGRSLRAFVLAAVVMPSLVTLAWFSILGGAAIEIQASGVDLGVRDFDTAPQATFRVLESYPLTRVFQIVAMALIAVFLVTSADSGAFVLAMFSEQKADPGVAARLYWGVVIAGLTAGAVLSQTGQDAMRALAVAGAMPLTFILFGQGAAATWRLWRGGRRVQPMSSDRSRPV